MARRLTPFGKYFLLERINVGGMAEVFKARTVGIEGFERIVAIKRILPSVAEDEEFIRMFVDEAKITSQLSHANLAQTFDLGKVDGAFYIAMEYVPGKDLRATFARLERRGERMPLALCAYVLSRVCDGLDYAHRKRDLAGRDLHIVHRDVSPQNVILGFEGEVKLIDFGIAKAANKVSRTQAGILKGKLGYLSPEQVRGLPLDGRSDIFAAGIVLYELCTGERLFKGDSDARVLEQVQEAQVRPPSLLEPSIPPKLERVILKALARDPGDRYQQAADLAADLQRFLLDLPKPVTRDDVASLMKAMFPDESAREAQGALGSTRRGAERAPPSADAAPDPVRQPAPRIRDSAAVPQRGAHPHTGPEAAPFTPSPVIRKSRQASPDASAQRRREEKMMGEGDPGATLCGPAPVDAPRAEIIVRSKLPSPERIERIRAGAKPGRSGNEPGRTTDRRGRTANHPGRDDDDPGLATTQPAVARPKPEPYGVRREMFLPASAGDSPAVAGKSAVARPGQRFLRAGSLKVAAVAILCGPGVGLVAAAASLFLASRSSTKRPPAASPPFAALQVRTDPADAVLLLDGAQVKGKADQQFGDKRLAAGIQHVLTARSEGYAEQSLTVNLKQGEQRAVALQLVPAPAAGDDPAIQPGFLSLGSRPDANVLIDGVDIGRRTPLLSWPLKPGSHRVRVEAAGDGKDFPVEIRSGETHSELVELGAAGARSGARQRDRR